LRYGELAQGVQAVAAALQAAGVRREERVFLLMHDCIDWPCAFLGAMYAGSVPVAANTLLKAEDYAYMLAKSRSQLAVVSQALLPVLLDAMALGPHELRQVVVSRAVSPLPEVKKLCHNRKTSGTSARSATTTTQGSMTTHLKENPSVSDHRAAGTGLIVLS
jgi:acyl-CoA synthetase (AMP-forming)/AMP-acid ligase II